MTKTLTEQWREGTLEDGFYYIKKNLCGIKDIKTEELFSGEFCTVPNEYIEEVLAPVPSYDEHNELKQDNKYLKSGIETRDKQIEQLEKKLETALEVFGIIAMHSKDPADAVQAACAISQIKEMEGVK